MYSQGKKKRRGCSRKKRERQQQERQQREQERQQRAQPRRRQNGLRLGNKTDLVVRMAGAAAPSPHGPAAFEEMRRRE